MITAKCMFVDECIAKEHVSDGCPFNRTDMQQTVNLLRIDCTVWQVYREPAKERRIRYAQEARLRNEVERSRRQDGSVEAGTGHKRPEGEASQEVR